MPSDAVVALVDAAVDAGVELPGVGGEAATAARFAGHWTERTRSGATPELGQRIYEVREVRDPTGVRGAMRRAEPGDRDFVLACHEAFANESGERAPDPARVERRLDGGQLWVWDDRGPVAFAGVTPAVAGARRLGPVYTPPDRRGRGYAAACVAALSRLALGDGDRCLLYTDLWNATSNAIYRRIGYEAVCEVLRYRIGG